MNEQGVGEKDSRAGREEPYQIGIWSEWRHGFQADIEHVDLFSEAVGQVWNRPVIVERGMTLVHG